MSEIELRMSGRKLRMSEIEPRMSEMEPMKSGGEPRNVAREHMMGGYRVVVADRRFRFRVQVSGFGRWVRHREYLY